MDPLTPLGGLVGKLVDLGAGGVIAAVLLTLLVVALFTIRFLYKELQKANVENIQAYKFIETCKDAHLKDVKELGEKSMKAIEIQVLASRNVTDAIETNGRMSEASRLTLLALKESFDTFTRLMAGDRLHDR